MNINFNLTDQLRGCFPSYRSRSMHNFFFKSCLTQILLEEKKLPYPISNKVITKKNHYKKYPDDIFIEIFKLVNPEIRLCSLRRVCHQFYEITQPFYDRCHALKHFIPKIKAIFDHEWGETGSYFFALNFTEEQNILVHRVNFPEITSNLKNRIKVAQDDQSNVLTTISRMTQDTATDYYHISDQTTTVFKYFENKKMVKLDSLVKLLHYLDNPILEKISKVLVEYGQEILLNGTHDLIKLNNNLLRCFSEETLDEELKMSLEKIFSNCVTDKNIYPLFVNLTLTSRDNIFERLKQKKLELLSYWGAIPSHKISFFFIGNVRENFFYTTYTINALPHHAELPEHYQWFSKRLTRKKIIVI